MPLSAFDELCEQRSMAPEQWKKILSAPIIPKKCLLDMTDEELEDHYTQVEERAENTQEDRALIVLERTQEGRLERQAVKVFSQNADEKGNIEAEMVPEMLESLRFELTNTEVHFLLHKFDCTEDFEMLPENPLTKRQWLWMVGECQMLKDSYKYVNPEAFEICYETMIQNLKMQKDAESDGGEEWPHIVPAGPDWYSERLERKMQPQSWGLLPEVESELMAQMSVK
mmetsp:Transcript_59257/g.138034  ORF Transcript_59257/g.138034 Transcript_59257/m.138034 type:complete len:227 (+) Transcript_59257:112-792(+)